MEIIHIVLGKANPNRMNGVNKVVYQLASKQAEAGQDVSVWGIAEDTDHNYGDRTFKTLLFQQMKNAFSLDKKLNEALTSKKENTIFHIHGGWVPTFSQVSKVLKKNKIPYVFTPHGAYNTIAMQRSGLRKKIYFLLFEKPLIAHAKKIHCIGESEVLGLNKIYKTSKTMLLPYGYEMPKLEAGGRKTSNKDFTIGFVGRLDIYTKGLDLLVEAFLKFQSQAPSSKLWIVGDSSEKEQLIQIIENKGLKNKVILFGSKFGEEKDKLLQGMDVFAHPSRNEGLPASVLEASSFAVPSIVSQATNVGSYIKKYRAGISIKNDNVDALHDAFIQMYWHWSNKEIDEFGMNAKKMVSDVFDWNKVLKDFDKLYEV